MDIRDFFNFCSKLSSSTVRASAIELDPIPDPTGTRFLDSDRLIVGEYGSLNFPILFKQEGHGKKWEDMLNTGCVSLYLISDQLKTVLEENNLTGWKTYPIKLLDKKGNEILGYSGFSITGRCGSIDYRKSEIVQKRIYQDGPIRSSYKGLYVGLDKWDGSDFFLPEGNLGIIVTEKVAKILKEKKLTNIDLINLADCETDEFIVRMVEEKRSLNK